jgi:site-specific recombinase XerC
MLLAMLLAGLRRCQVLGLRFEDVQAADRRLVVVEGKGGHHRVVPAAVRPDGVCLGAVSSLRAAPAVEGSGKVIVAEGSAKNIQKCSVGCDGNYPRG